MRDRISQSVSIVKEAIGGQKRWLIELIQRAVQRVSPRSQHLIDGAAARVAKSGVGIEQLHRHFLDGVLRRAIGGAHIPGGVGGSVHQHLARLRRCAADAEVVARIIRPHHRGCAVERADDNPHGQLGQHHRGSAVEWKILHLFGGDGLAQGCILVVDQRRFFGHFYRLRRIADV